MSKDNLIDKLNGCWFEQYRPTNLDELALSEDVKLFLENSIEQQTIPNLLLYGQPGTGKNSIVNVIINNIDCNYISINASSETGIDTIREKVETFANTASWGNKLKICILNEMDALSIQAQKSLKEVMETTLSNCRYILTSNEYNKINTAIISRCTEFEIKPPKSEIFKRLCDIFDKENIIYESEYIEQIIKKYNTNIRKMIGESYKFYIAYGDLKKEYITFEIDNKTKEYFDEVFNTSDIRKINELTKNFIFDEDVYTMLKDYCAETYNNSTLMISIAEGAYRTKIVNDKDLVLLSTILEIQEILKG